MFGVISGIAMLFAGGGMVGHGVDVVSGDGKKTMDPKLEMLIGYAVLITGALLTRHCIGF